MPKKNEDSQTVIRTEDYDGESMPAGQLDSEGITFEFNDLQKDEGKYGEFWKLVGTKPNGQAVQILTSSKRLAGAITRNYDRLIGRVINVAGFGEKFERQYRITVVDNE